MLLGDTRSIFERRALDAETNPNWNEMSSKQLAEALGVMEGRPWPDWKGRPISSNAVAPTLKPFGIVPGRVGDRKKDSGYALVQFEEAFTRYLPPFTTSATSAALKTNGNSQEQSSANGPGAELADRHIGNGINGAEVAEVAEVESPPPESARDIGPDGDAPPWEIIL